MNFSDLGLSEDVLRAVTDAGYVTPTPIQAEAIPVVLTGRDILASAQTGTGKTASFTLPMIDILAAGHAKARMPRSLILEPTRELAAQVAASFDVYGKYTRLSKALLIGGESMADQMRVMDRGVDVLIATPGRLLDMFERGKLLMTDVKILVIDEADRMLDMGFIPDVERIVSLVSRIRQTLFFSATMPPEIRRLADAFLSNPKRISVSPPSTPAETVKQSLVMIDLPKGTKPGGGQKEKRAALRKALTEETVKSALVFCNRKRDVGVVHRSLNRHGYNAGQLHGDMPQSTRTDTLNAFKRGEITLLVCSDVAARGLDIQDMSHVFNFDVPSHAEDYVHRIGRTGRAGREGRAITFATSEDRKYLAAIGRLIGMPIPSASAKTKAEPAAPVEADVEAETEAEAKPESRSRRRRKSRTEAKAEDGKDKAAQTKAKTDRKEPEAKPDRKEPEAKPDRKKPEAKTDRKEPASKSAKEKRQPQESRGKAKKAKPETAKGKSGPRDDGRPVRGMGDHVPAFMLRPVYKEKSGS